MIDFQVITLRLDHATQVIFVSSIEICFVLHIHWIKLLPFNVPCASVLVLPSLHFLLVITVMLCAIVPLAVFF